jgi:2-keto-3-deoxy-L-rhamnonate aldolase RhmA
MSEIHAILRNHMKEKLGRGELVASMTVRLTRSIEIAQIAKTAGFDTLYVDLEHNTLSIDTCCQICIFAQQIGITPLARVPAIAAANAAGKHVGIGGLASRDDLMTSLSIWALDLFQLERIWRF